MASVVGSNRPGLPSAGTVVHEFALRASPFVAARPEAAATEAPGPTPRREYRVLRTTQVDEYDAPVTAADVLAAAAPPGDAFTGKSRKAAKISISRAKVERFDDLRDLVETLPSVEDMRDREPPIARTPESGRVREERRNVRVRAWIYAASRENDNDFHLILGRDPARSPMYFTMEVSGLPPSGTRHRARLRRVRDDYKSFFGATEMGLPGTSYDFYDPPVPVEIAGSLFFDASHATGGRPGPQDLRDDMPTVWEVHPVTDIVFEP